MRMRNVALFAVVLVTLAVAGQTLVAEKAALTYPESKRIDQVDDPVLIRIETKSGHGSVNTSKMIQEMADEYAFMFYNMGIKID